MWWITVLSIAGIGGLFWFLEKRDEDTKESKDFQRHIDLLALMDNMREFLRAGTSIDQVYQMMPPELRNDERRLHDSNKDDKCYCLVCCLARDAHNTTSIQERMIH